MRARLWLTLPLLCVSPLLAEEYEIGPGDVLHIVVVGQADMTGNFPVDTEGVLSFPVLGKIKAGVEALNVPGAIRATIELS